jgi:hypothetical protein
MKEACTIAKICIIRGNKIILGDKVILEYDGIDFAGFATHSYRHFQINYPKFHKMDNLGKLGFLAAELLICDSGLTTKYKGEETGVIFMNSSSSLDTDKNHQRSISMRDNYFPSPAVFVYTLPNVVIGEICIRHRITGEGNFLVSEIFNPLLLYNYVSTLFDRGCIESCITGWVEINGNNFESVLFLIEKSGSTETGIANFEPSALQKIYNSK